MMKSTLTFLLLFMSLYLGAQKEINFPDVIYGPENITASWVSHPDLIGSSDQVILFRNTFEVEDTMADFIINISADNHYFLFVNGQVVTHGPQLGDQKHWKYETLNLKQFLSKGKNVVAIKVVNYGKRRFLGFTSLYTCLLVNGITPNAKVLSTSGKEDNWKCLLDQSYKAIEINWREEGERSIVGGFYCNNPTDHVDMKRHPKGWQGLIFDDSEWQRNKFYESGSSMGGSIGYLLEPRNLPLLTWEEEAIKAIVRSEPLTSSQFPMKEITIPANTKLTFLLDQKVVTNGFPELVFSRGKYSDIKIKYAENLFGANNEKGDRDDLHGKKLLGYYDKIISSGDDHQKFIPNWMRTFRFIEFEIETMDEALTLHSFVNNKSRTSLPSIAEFTSDNEVYNEIFNICKRTTDICTQDYFLSDAYYETLQYVGDSKVQALVWQAMSGNTAHTENAIRQFDHSRDSEGNILGAYPLRSIFIYPTYSLVWIDMVADLYELKQDKNLIHQYKNGIIHTLGGFEDNINNLNLVKRTKYRYFVDWYTGPNNGGGTATNNGGENSAVVSLHYVHALTKASILLEAIGDHSTSQKYLQKAHETRKAVFDLCYDSDKGLFAERPDKTVYDQHTNIMAILTDAIPRDEQKDLLIKILENKSLLQATYYYRYYLFEAIKKVDAPELFDLAQKPWLKMIADNMTTTLERFESEEKPTRSEVHPWSASPAYFYFNYLAGIRSTKNNFEEVRIAPVFGELKWIDGLLPTRLGNISFRLEKSGESLVAEVDIPSGMEGVIVWKESEIKLKHGQKEYVIK